jgi:hypothetical protein
VKILLFLFSIAIAAAGYGQAGKLKNTSMNSAVTSSVPAEVITDDSTFWTLSTVSTVGYVNKTPGANYNTYQSGGGMLVKFRFKKNNRFEFGLYIQVNIYGTLSETWTQVEGTVEFTKDTKGQQIFITKAEKGTYRTNKNGVNSSRPIPENELRVQHSHTYLWEKTNFPDDALNTYLLVVDLKEHPEVDISNPKTIDPSWVSKFHIPAKK